MADDKPIFLQQSDDRFIPNDVAPSTEKVELPAAICKHIDQWMKRYPRDQKRSAVFEALRVVQIQNGGYLTVALMDAVADYLQMTRIAVYEIAAFYTLYSLNKVGRNVIYFCTNVSCMLNGAEELLAHLKKKLNIEVNQTTEDEQFTLKEVECLGACINAPVCQVGTDFHENLTIEKIDALLNGLRSGNRGK